MWTQKILLVCRWEDLDSLEEVIRDLNRKSFNFWRQREGVENWVGRRVNDGRIRG